MAVSKAEILDAIAGMTVLELSEMIKEMEEKFGVSAAAVASAAPAGGGAAPAAAVEEKTEFDVILTDFGAKQGQTSSRAVREITGLGLKEAKDLVDGAPKPVKEAISEGRRRSRQEEAGRRRREGRHQVIVTASSRIPSGRRRSRRPPDGAGPVRRRRRRPLRIPGVSRVRSVPRIPAAHRVVSTGSASASVDTEVHEQGLAMAFRLGSRGGCGGVCRGWL